MLILLIGVARELIRRGLGPVAVVQLLPYVLPISLQFAFPATALFSVCCVYGRMASDGEVATVKASGITPLKLLQPALVFAALLSPVAVMVSDLAVSWGRPGVNRVVLMSIEDIAYRVLQSDRHYKSEHGFSIHVRDVVGRRLIQPTVTMRSGPAGTTIKLTAREGELSLDSATATLKLRMVDGRVEGDDDFQAIIPDEEVIPISLGNSLSEKDPSERSPSELPLSMISSQTIRQDANTHAIAGRIAAQRGFAMLTSRFDKLVGASQQISANELRSSRRRLTKLRTEPWRRWAWGFSCFCFVLVGGPLAMIAKTNDYWTTFGMCFLPTLLVYYPLFIVGLEQAKDGNIPPYGVWLGNIVLAFIGVGLMQRVRRY